MRKLPNDLESPIDNLLYIIIEQIAPTIHKYGFTPNILTTIGNIFTLLFAHFMFKGNFKIAALFIFIAYIFDCLDGYIARSYNMVTKFGDWYDHISDLIRILIIFYVLIKINPKLGLLVVLIIIILIFLSCVYLSHQEIFYGQPDISHTLNILQSINFGANKKNVKEYLQVTKYFGCGTTHLLITLIVFFYKKR